MHCPISTPATDAAQPEDLFQLLAQLKVPYRLYHHAPMFSMADGDKLVDQIPGAHCKNLFLYDKKDQMFLVTTPQETRLDLKILAERLGTGRLSFGSPERLWDNLRVRPGSVCPFALMNPQAGAVNLILEEHTLQAESLNFHPLDNAMTIALHPTGLLTFLDHLGHKPRILSGKI